MSRPATFTPEVKLGVLYRDGHTCCMVGTRGCHGAADEHPNHRLNRGVGGSSDPKINTPANGCAICHRCNWAIEAIPDIREEALRRGVKLTRGQNPEISPMWSPFLRQWIIPRSDGAILTGLTDSTLDARTLVIW